MNLPKKDLFHIPKGIIYLSGNSLGMLPQSVPKKVNDMIQNEWGKQLVAGWNDSDWINLPIRVGNQIAKLIGATKNSVVVGDTLSIKIYQALTAALKMRLNRKIILSDSGNFPTDLYIAQGLIDSLGNGYQLKIVEPEEIKNAIDETIAVVMLTEVDYKTGYKHNVKKLVKKAHQNGALTLIDLAHSAGAVEVNATQSNCDFAAGCTYKYLNGGPGSPAFIYVREDLIQKTSPALAGWMGHLNPFSFEPNYAPAIDIQRMRIGTPAIIQMVCLEEALKVWDEVNIKEIRQKSMELSELFIQEVEKVTDKLKLISPRNPKNRGSQVSFTFKYGYAMIQALIANGVIGDFRAPNVMRFGFTPLYIDEGDVLKACKIIKKVFETGAYKKEKYKVKGRVT